MTDKERGVHGSLTTRCTKSQILQMSWVVLSLGFLIPNQVANQLAK